MGRRPGEGGGGQSGDPSPSPSPWQRGDCTQPLAPWTFLLVVNRSLRLGCEACPGLGRFPHCLHLPTWPGAGPAATVHLVSAVHLGKASVKSQLL